MIGFKEKIRAICVEKCCDYAIKANAAKESCEFLEFLIIASRRDAYADLLEEIDSMEKVKE